MYRSFTTTRYVLHDDDHICNTFLSTQYTGFLHCTAVLSTPQHHVLQHRDVVRTVLGEAVTYFLLFMYLPAYCLVSGLPITSETFVSRPSIQNLSTPPSPQSLSILTLLTVPVLLAPVSGSVTVATTVQAPQPPS